jgi:hypothetical protein
VRPPPECCEHAGRLRDRLRLARAGTTLTLGVPPPAPRNVTFSILNAWTEKPDNSEREQTGAPSRIDRERG